MSIEREELIERVKGEIAHHISPVIGWLRMDAAKGVADADGKRHDAWLERLDKAAEAVADLLEAAAPNIRAQALEDAAASWDMRSGEFEDTTPGYLQYCADNERKAK